MRTSSGPLNAYDYLQGVLQLTGTACARRVQLERVASPWMSDLPYSIEGLVTARERVSEASAAQPHETAIRRLDAELARATTFALEPRGRDALAPVEEFEQSQSTLDRMAETAASFWVSRGLSMTGTKIFLVDALPSPFDRGAGSVIAIDAEDERRFNIAQGIYFTPAAMTPIFAEYTIGHELVHAHLGSKSPEILATHNEEGAADFVAIFDFARTRFGEAVAGNVAKMHRLTSASGLTWEHYVDGMRATLRRIGDTSLGALYGALRDGRLDFARFMRGDRDGSEHVLPIADESAVRKLADSILLTFPRNSVVSSLAYEVALATHDGMTVREIAHESRLSLEQVGTGLHDLEVEGYVHLRRDGLVVEYSAVAALIANSELRFDFRDIQ